jgi:predicted flap endonuclease-1-like 5' DNA nuclease
MGGCTCAEPLRCGVPCLERPLFSAGQLLTADSLRLGQRYLHDRFALRRYLDGVGVVCGMHVRCDPERPGWIIVDAGYAVDACGGDLALCEPVGFDLCAAVNACPRPTLPCGDDVAPAQQVETGPLELGPVFPGTTQPGKLLAVLTGRVFDSTGAPLAGAVIHLDGFPFQAQTGTDGAYRLELEANRIFTVSATQPGYRVATRSAMLALNQITTADFPLVRPQPATPQPPADTTCVYVLRAEPVWEGCDPVPVVTRPGPADPRPECRPSREAASMRLCVQPLAEPNPEARAADRTDRFRRLGQPLFERLGTALEAGGKPAETVVDALLRWVRENPPRSVCGTATLLSELRRAIRGEPPKCDLPEWVRRNPGHALVEIVGHLVDDLREGFLALACHDCAPHPGVRLAHVVIDPRLAGCSGTGCHIAGIDTHPPAREALHPLGTWWRGDRVPLYDGYFRPVHDAAVLLTGRGLTVTPRDAAQAPYTPEMNYLVRGWFEESEGGGQLRRLGVYQQAELYAGYASRVVLWTVAGRVVCIETLTPGGENLPRFSCVEYLTGPLTMQAEPLRGEVSQEVSTPTEMEAAALRDRSSVLAEETAATAAGGGGVVMAPPTLLAALDPAPLEKLITGIGLKSEAEFFRQGIRTLTQLAAADYQNVHAALGGRFPLAPEMFAAMREQAREYMDGSRTVPWADLQLWAAAARARLDPVDGRTA